MLKDERMKALYGAVRTNVTVCDVGTDHASIPIELILSGKSPRCIITDISAPSLEKGAMNAKSAGCSDKISAFCANGTLGVPLDDEMDVIIAGMGGELISQILDQDIRLKNSKYRFALQPMSKADELRSYLAQSGFEILSESKVKAVGRVYPIIVCAYTGKTYALDTVTRLLGFKSATNGLEKEYAERVIKALSVKLDGIKSAENPDTLLIERLENEINEVKKAVL